MNDNDDLAQIQNVHNAYKRMQEELGKVVVGQTHVVEEVLMAFSSVFPASRKRCSSAP